ncbi:MAG: alpha/beta fold hydrolase [Actinobacteria bacterium]|nr:alpha/beta fold hydrolase [Actinomycetota bacterium]
MTSATESAEIGELITAGGIETNVHIRSHPTSSDTVLLLHGSGPGVSAFANWRLTIPHLEQEMTVIAPDIVGFGFTERPTDVSYDLETWTTHAVDVLDALGVERAHVVGNSFGGALALSLAAHHPNRVDRMVLMGAVGVPFDITRGLDAVWGYEPSVEIAYDKSLLGDDLAALRYHASIRPGVQEAFHAMFPEPRQAALDALCLPEDQVRKIATPTLLVHGRDDQVIPLEASLRLLDLIDNSQLHVFGRCGHWTQIERSEEFAALISDFLQR